MVDRWRTLRNVAIVLGLGAAVHFLPEGGRVAHTVGAILAVAFGAGIALFAARLYLENRVTIYSLGDRDRALFYVAIGTGVVLAAAQPRMWQTGAGEFAWFVLAGLVVLALVSVYRRWKAY